MDLKQLLQTSWGEVHTKMNKLAHNLASIGKELYLNGFEKEAKNMLFTSLRIAHMDHPLHGVMMDMGFDKANNEDNKKEKLEIFIHIHPDGQSEYELTHGENFSEKFDNYEELISSLHELLEDEMEDESDCDCGCGGNCKTAAAKKKNQGKKLNKPFRTPGGPKKFSVYVKNEKGNVIKVNFGDPNMSIKRDQPNRRKNFRARHNCDNPGPKTKARYWSCRMWSKPSVSKILKGK